MFSLAFIKYCAILNSVIGKKITCSLKIYIKPCFFP